MSTKKIPPPERRRKPDFYSADELHEILVDDGIHHRPLGGNGERGIQWMMDALGKIAAVRRQEIEVAFTAVVDDIESQTGLGQLVVG